MRTKPKNIRDRPIYSNPMCRKMEKVIFILNIMWWMIWTFITFISILLNLQPFSKIDGFQSIILLLGLEAIFSVITLLIFDSHPCKRVIIYENGITNLFVQLSEKSMGNGNLISYSEIRCFEVTPLENCIITTQSGKKIQYLKKWIGKDAVDFIIKTLREHGITEKVKGEG